MNLTQQFGAKMKAHRDWRTIADIADKVGCSKSTIEKMERGERLPRLPIYVRLCRRYDLSPAARAELDNIVASVADDGAGE